MLARMKVKQMQREKSKSIVSRKTDVDDNIENSTKKINDNIRKSDTSASDNLNGTGAGNDEIEIIDLNVETTAESHELTSEERLDMLLKGMMPQPQPEPVEAVETTESVEKVEPVGTIESIGMVESVDAVELVETVKPIESVDKLEKELEVSIKPTQEQVENEINETLNNTEETAEKENTQEEKKEESSTVEQQEETDKKNNADIINDKSIMTDDVNKYSEELGIKELRQELRRVKYNSKFAATLYNTVGTLIVVAALAILVANLWLPVLQVTGTSMSPTLEEGQVLVASKGSSFKTGDVVAFYYNNKILVKRVIAMPGDWVNISDDGTVYVNDIAIDEPYLKEKALGDCNIELPYQVPESKIFVMGDNRSVSLDSRNTAIGCISEEQVVGKVSFGLWPLSKFGSID